MVRLLDIDHIPKADRSKLQGEQFQDVREELDSLRDLCAKLNEIIEQAPDGIYVTDGDANAIRINPAFERISGLKRESMLGRNHRDLEKDGVVSRSSALMVVRDRKPVTIIHEYLPTNRQALVTSIPVFGENGEMELIVSSTRDLTELNDVKAKLAREKECRLKYERQIETIQSQILDANEIVAVDKKTLDMLSAASRVALADSTVLITGETGVGKEEVAKYIHKHSARSKKPFIAVNCGAIPENLVESELFGYEKGSFTGARQEGKMGLLEVADQGTIFLDEVGELPLEIQVKLLRALETRTVTRVGGSKPIPIDIRVISATNRDLMEMVKEHRFREDLYYRLRVVPIHIPALRERTDDIIPLTKMFLAQYSEKYGLNKDFSHMAYRVLHQYEWPGNVRELKNVVERMVVMSDGDTITAEELPMYQERFWGLYANDRNLSLKELLEKAEYMYMTDAYKKYKSVRKAAAALQMTMPTFIRKRQKYEEKYPLQK